jgi:hypothetical protein
MKARKKCVFPFSVFVLLRSKAHHSIQQLPNTARTSYDFPLPRHPRSSSSPIQSSSTPHPSRLRRFLSLRSPRDKHEEPSLRRSRTTRQPRPAVPTMIFSPFVTSFEETPAARYIRRRSSLPAAFAMPRDSCRLLIRFDEFDGATAQASIEEEELLQNRARSQSVVARGRVAESTLSPPPFVVAPPLVRMPPFPSSRFIEDLDAPPHPARRIRFVLPQRPIAEPSPPSASPSLSRRRTPSSRSSFSSDSVSSSSSSLDLHIPLYAAYDATSPPLRPPISDFPQPPATRLSTEQAVSEARLVQVDRIGVVKRQASLVRSSSLRSNSAKRAVTIERV